MKTKLSAFILLFLISVVSVNAQLDRSKQPKAGPEPSISLEVPSEFELKNGLKVLVVENHKLPRVTYSLNIDNKHVASGAKAGVESLIGSMLGNGTTSIPKDEFNEEIDFLGASLNLGINGGFARTLSKYSERILELMADAAINPLLTEEEFNKEKDKLIEGLKTQEKSIDAISGRVGDALLFGAKHPYGEYVTEETINNVTYGDAVAYYQKHFNPNNAYLVIIGDVDLSTVRKQVKKYFKDWEKSIDVSTSVPAVNPNAQYTQINFVDLPNASQSSIAIKNSVDLKMGDEDYHASIITNDILGGGFTGYLYQNLRETNGYTYGAYSRIRANRYGAGSFSATAKVRNIVTDSAVVEAMKEINRLKTETVDAQNLKDTKAKYVGNFIMGLEDPQTVARYALNIKLNNLPKNFYTTYLQKINAVTADDVKRVANKYIKPENARIVIVGKGSDVIENLEKTGIPIKYYDKYANSVDKPVYDVELPAGVTAKSVMNNYLKASGVKDNMDTIKSVMTQYVATTPMGEVMSEEKRLDGKTVQNIYMGENKVMSMVMTQESATSNTQPLPENVKNDLKANAGLFMEINLVNSDLAKITGIEKIDGKDAYAIEVSGEVISFILYYDVETGLKVKEVQNTVMQGQTQTQEAILKDYKDYNGLKFPSIRDASMMGQAVMFKLKEVKINEDVTDADFN